MLPEAIKPALQGVFPSVIGTCSLDGIPNITVISQVWYVDPEHVALSFQFFNKTIRNIRANPHAVVQVIHPETIERWVLDLQFVRSESEGPLFEQMDMQLEAIASMSGMSDVFKLLAADVYRVKSVRRLAEEMTPEVAVG